MSPKTSSNPRKRKAVSFHRQRNSISTVLSDVSEVEEHSEAAEQSDVEELPEPTWSPWDPLERNKVDIRDLDLDVSYVETLSRPSLNQATANYFEEPQPKRKRWQRQGNKKINRVEDLPKGWDATEPDLDPK